MDDYLNSDSFTAAAARLHQRVAAVRAFRALQRPAPRWWVLLAALVRPQAVEYNYRRFSRRHLYAGLYLPSSHPGIPVVCVVVDTSGSVWRLAEPSHRRLRDLPPRALQRDSGVGAYAAPPRTPLGA